MKIVLSGVIGVLFSAAAMGAIAKVTSSLWDADPKLPFKKVMIVILENEDAKDALAQPYLRSLAKRGTYLNQHHAITHPSQPNYIAMVSGSTHRVGDNSNVSIVAQHIGDLLEARGLPWKNYAEDYPGGCYQKESKGRYVRKHVPFLSFHNVQKDLQRCLRSIVPATELDLDIERGTIPTFSVYTPNQDNNGHDTRVAFADKWMQKRFGPLLDDPRFMDDMLLVVTFDEGTYLSPNKVYTVLLGPNVEVGRVVETRYDHYNLLRTIEDNFALGTLGLNDQNAQPIEGIWR